MDPVARRSVLRAVGAMAVGSALAGAGCSSRGGVPTELGEALTQARAAVRSGALALDLLDRGRTSTAAAQTTLHDMARELTAAGQQVATVTTRRADQRRLREIAASAVLTGWRAVADAEDALDRHPERTALRSGLADADHTIEQAITVVGGG